MKKLNYSGISHIILPLLIVIAIGIAGTFMLVSSHASDLKTRAPVNFKCKSGQFLVNAVPEDYMPGSKNRNQAKKGHGLLCVKNPIGRVVVEGYNADTISYVLNCRSNETFAFDDRNDDGTGYHTAWRLRSRSGGNSNGIKTYYCIPNKFVNDFSTEYGKGITVYSNGKDHEFIKDITGSHNYFFKPGFKSVKKGCDAEAKKYTGCRPNYFFSYYRNGDVINRK